MRVNVRTPSKAKPAPDPVQETNRRHASDTPLVVEDLHVTVGRGRRRVPIVRGVSFSVEAGNTLGIVGESGSGKSVTARALLGLLGPGFEVSGSVRLNGTELVGLPEREMRRYRGAGLAMVFQDPMRSLNPTMRVGEQIAEAVRLHRHVSKDEAKTEAVSLLKAVRISDADRRAGEYPHQLSGGMRQRVMIAIALAARPSVLVADEPTTALDVTTEAQILALLDDLKSRYSMGVVLITHDLGVASVHTDRLAVMYAGRLVEAAATGLMLGAIRHPYTQALLDAVPSADIAPHSPLASIPGVPPDPADLPPGCAFAPRCPSVGERCREERPELAEAEPGHAWACWHPLGVG